MINEYFINEDTLIIVPDDNNSTRIYDNDGIYNINTKTFNIINESCLYYGSSYGGRYIGSKKMLEMNYKLPIILDEVKEVIMIPSCSPNSDKCCWICLNNIENYRKTNNNTTIYFTNGIEYEIDISYASIENQILRATLLLTKLRKRKNTIKKIG